MGIPQQLALSVFDWELDWSNCLSQCNRGLCVVYR